MVNEIESKEATKTQVHVLDRVISYPIVHNIYGSAAGFYSQAKTNPYLKYGLESAEHKIVELAKVATPVVQSQIETITTSPYYQPLLNQIDTFGNQGLDKLESTLTSLSPLVSPGSSSVDASKPTTSYKNYAEVISSSIDAALTRAEDVVQKYVPSEEEKESLPKDNVPVTRVVSLGTRVSKHLHKQALSKLKNLSFRSKDQLATMNYCVDLLKYAAENIDTTSKKIQQQSFEFITTSPALKGVRENPVVVKVTENILAVKDKLYNTTTSTLDTITKTSQFAVTSASKLPPFEFKTLSDKLQQAIAIVKDKYNVTEAGTRIYTIGITSFATVMEASKLIPVDVPAVYTKTEAQLQGILGAIYSWSKQEVQPTPTTTGVKYFEQETIKYTRISLQKTFDFVEQIKTAQKKGTLAQEASTAATHATIFITGVFDRLILLSKGQITVNQIVSHYYPASSSVSASASEETKVESIVTRHEELKHEPILEEKLEEIVIQEVKEEKEKEERKTEINVEVEEEEREIDGEKEEYQEEEEIKAEVNELEEEEKDGYQEEEEEINQEEIERSQEEEEEEE